jgi:hypothetical protein
VGRHLSLRRVCVSRDVGGFAVPSRLTAFLQPINNHRLPTKDLGQRRGGLPSPKERRDVELIDVLVTQRLAQQFSLSETVVVQRGINDAKAVLYPFRLAMTKEHNFHGQTVAPTSTLGRCHTCGATSVID